MTTPTIEQIIEHHLSQNSGQKLTPHLIAGLMILMAQNMKKSGLLKDPTAIDGSIVEQ